MISFDNINIFQVGVGGTGSWLVPYCIKLFKNITDAYAIKNITYYLIDDDIVEPVNIKRQNFDSEDVDRNKAITTLRKYNHVFTKMIPLKLKINIKELRRLFKNLNNENTINIIVGCTDSSECRRDIYTFMIKRRKENIIYIDSGNNLYEGQIITTFNRNIKSTNFGNWQKRVIDFLEKFKDIPPNENEVEPTCELFGNQSLQINSLAATLLYTTIHNILVLNRLPAEELLFSNYGYCTFNI